MPYYEQDGIVIYHGDCREISPLVVADALITDPPYGLGVKPGGRGKSDYDSAFFSDTEEYVESVIVPVITDAIQRCGRGALTPGTRCLHLYPRYSDIGGFFQPAAVGLSPWGFASFNPVLFYGKCPTAGKHNTGTMVVLNEPPSDDRHPCAKPMSACRWMIGKASKHGETIFDPFAGVGTFLIAAKQMGRKAIGIEIEEHYCEIAAKRLAQGVLPMELEQRHVPMALDLGDGAGVECGKEPGLATGNLP